MRQVENFANVWPTLVRGRGQLKSDLHMRSNSNEVLVLGGMQYLSVNSEQATSTQSFSLKPFNECTSSKIRAFFRIEKQLERL